MTKETLGAICDLTVSLTELRLSKCEHLSIENFAPDLFGKLVKEYLWAKKKGVIKI